MIKILNLLYEAIMPQYDHTKHVVPLPNDKKPVSVKKPKLPNDVLYDKAFQNLVRQSWDIDNNSFEMSVYKIADKNADKFTNELTDIDFALIQEKSLDPLKAIRLKPLWAKGLSSQAVSEDLSRSERGYGWTELRKYWTVFNEAAKVDDESEKPIKPLPQKAKRGKTKKVSQ